eukprot:6089135-Pyramimonas_sp.AAC.1
MAKCVMMRANLVPLLNPWTTEWDDSIGSVAAPSCNKARQTIHCRSSIYKMTGGNDDLNAALASKCHGMES